MQPNCAVVRGVRRAARSRRRRRPVERDAARRRCAAAQRHRQLGAARRLRPVLRADAVGGRIVQVQSVRDLHRYAVRRRRRDAAHAAGAVRPCDRAEPAHRASRHLGRQLRIPLEAVALGARQLSRPAGQPRADAQRGADAGGRRAASSSRAANRSIAISRSAFISAMRAAPISPPPIRGRSPKAISIRSPPITMPCCGRWCRRAATAGCPPTCRTVFSRAAACCRRRTG